MPANKAIAGSTTSKIKRSCLRPSRANRRDFLDDGASAAGEVLASGAGTILSGFSLMMLNRWRLRVAPDFPQSVTEGVKPYKSDGGHKPWTPAQCAAAEKNFTGMVRRAYFLARYTGQRGSDVVRLAETFIDDGGFRLIQKKTGREVWCPIDEALAAEMAT